MQVITIVEGKVPNSRAKEFEANFASAKREPVPSGLVSSLLLKNSKNSESYRIQTIWESIDALERMRRGTTAPKAIELFQRNGVQPTLEIFEILDNIP